MINSPLGRTRLLFSVVFSLLFTLTGLVQPGLAQESTLADKINALAQLAQTGATAAAQQDVTAMQAQYDELHETWESFEDDVRSQNPTAYVELEGALAAVKATLQAQPVDAAAVAQAYRHLNAEAVEIAEKFEQGEFTSVPTASTASPADLLPKLDAAYQAVEAGDTAAATEHIEAVVLAWPSVEGAIAAKSPDTYTAIEVDLSRATGALKAGDLTTAEIAIEGLRDHLSPFAVTIRYTMFDAAAIVLREGLEALLVVVALLAFLKRSGNSDKGRWIWVGAIAGVLVSIAAAFGLQAIFSRAMAGQNREIIEGMTGLVAAALLFYVSYWLHSKSNLHIWQKYINNQTTQALAKGSMFSLALLSFLAIFREGAETTVFYLGLAPAIAFNDLVLGLGIGVAILVIIAVLMLKVGLRIPLRPFFFVASLLVYYLGFKFVGSGIHALQVGGVLPASPVEFLRAVPSIGLYPTWEVVGPQLVLLLAALAVIVYLRSQSRARVVAN